MNLNCGTKAVVKRGVCLISVCWLVYFGVGCVLSVYADWSFVVCHLNLGYKLIPAKGL